MTIQATATIKIHNMNTGLINHQKSNNLFKEWDFLILECIYITDDLMCSLGRECSI